MSLCAPPWAYSNDKLVGSARHLLITLRAEAVAGGYEGFVLNTLVKANLKLKTFEAVQLIVWDKFFLIDEHGLSGFV